MWPLAQAALSIKPEMACGLHKTLVHTLCFGWSVCSDSWVWRNPVDPRGHGTSWSYRPRSPAPPGLALQLQLHLLGLACIAFIFPSPYPSYMEQVPSTLPLSAPSSVSSAVPFRSPLIVSLKGWVQALPGSSLFQPSHSEISDHSLPWPILQRLELSWPSIPSPQEH